MKGNALLGMAAIALAAGMGAGDAAEDALRSDKGKPQAKTINVKVARKEAPAVRMIDNYNEGGITFDIEAANPGKDKFKQKSG